MASNWKDEALHAKWRHEQAERAPRCTSGGLGHDYSEASAMHSGDEAVPAPPEVCHHGPGRRKEGQCAAQIRDDDHPRSSQEEEAEGEGRSLREATPDHRPAEGGGKNLREEEMARDSHRHATSHAAGCQGFGRLEGARSCDQAQPRCANPPALVEGVLLQDCLASGH